MYWSNSAGQAGAGQFVQGEMVGVFLVVDMHRLLMWMKCDSYLFLVPATSYSAIRNRSIYRLPTAKGVEKCSFVSCREGNSTLQGGGARYP
jgi:hypothetical protein